MRVEGLWIQGKQLGGELKQIRHMFVYYQTFPSYLHSEQKFRIRFKCWRRFPLRRLSFGDPFDHFPPLPIRTHHITA